ncbi:MAG: type II toxin-antitoxin system RelE/ParE family toxin [Candidatus Marinimicrobia bacterium]|nr:type II toxin-antitoxin system RelE/ParE family toxin [Candidatus Neomarinimicrobiota bacterium]
MRIIWSPLSLDRVTEIAKYVAEENRTAAVELVEHLFSRVAQLSEYPDSGPIVPELGRPDVRQLVDGSYRIIYKVETEIISILTVRHHRQSFSEDDI